MDDNIKVSNVTVRIENLSLINILTNLEKINSKGIVIMPYTINAYVNGYPVAFNVVSFKNSVAVNITCEEPTVLDRLVKTIQEAFGDSEK